MDDLRLSPRQEEAVSSSARALVVVAGAGCGKTEVVARRVERLLADSEEEGFRVLAVSYTVKAADELRERLAQRLGDLHRRVDADTVHGFALSLLRQHGTRIGLPPEPEVLSRDEDRYELLADWLDQQGQRPTIEPGTTFRELDLARAKRQSVPYLEDWRGALTAAGAVDYPAMLERAVELLEGPVVRRSLRAIFEHVVVDEAQNLTETQYYFLRLLIGDPESNHIKTVLVGDEHQSIVGFAGADRTLMERFNKEYGGERIQLETNYRSALHVVEVGQRVAAELGRPHERFDFEYPAAGSVEVRQFPSETAEGDGVAKWVEQLLDSGLDPSVVAPGEGRSVPQEQIAVLSRSAAALILTREALTRRDIVSASASTPDEWVTSPPAQAILEIVGFQSTSNPISARRRLSSLCGIEDAVEWSDLTELFSACQDSSVGRLAGLVKAESPAEVVEALDYLALDDPDWPDDRRQIISAWESFVDQVPVARRSFAEFKQHIARCQRGDAFGPGVRLLTVHKAQGQEFRSVVVVACNDGQFPDFRATSDEEREAELRTFYVAVSRPARTLLLTRAASRATRYGTRRTDPSPFLALVSGT